MKKEYFLFVAALFFIVTELFSQNSKIEYQTFTKNTIDTTGIRTYLLFDKKKSLFVWKSVSQEANTSKEVSEEGVIEIKKVFKDTLGTRVFNDYSDSILILNEPLLGENYTVVDKKINDSWKIEDSFKEIGGVTCQKARIKLRGREYIAWFAQEIPVPAGPWKLNGLPGLIVEATDLDKEVNFLFKSLHYNIDPQEEIMIENKENNSISVQEFVQIKDNLHQKLINQTLSKLPRGAKVLNMENRTRSGIETEFEWEEETKEN